MKRGEGLRSCCRKRWEDLWSKPGGVLGSGRWEGERVCLEEECNSFVERAFVYEFL